MSTDLLILLSLIETALLVVVLALALTRVRVRLTAISNGLKDLAGALTTVEGQHLRPLTPLVTQINARLQTILSVLPGIAGKAALVVRKVTGG
jgi:ABC-type sulfate transport system permease subunit